MTERRRHKRIKALLDQEAVALIRHELQVLPASLANLSTDGALLRFPTAVVGLEAGSIVSLWLDSGGTFLKIEALVIRTEPGYAAVQFRGMNADESNEIKTKMIRMEIIGARLGGSWLEAK